MKTATITFHAPNNNGSFLQAYALQKYLKNHFNNLDNDIIDFQPEAQQQQYAIIRKVNSPKDILRNFISIAHYRDLSKRTDTFKKMRERYLKMTSRCMTADEAIDVARKYDLVIAGSDQIWNTTARDFSEAYILPDIPKKATYAVSCGSNINEIDRDKICHAIESFENISVRENATRDFLEAHSHKNVKTVLDPTFLLTKEDYSELYEKEPLIKEKYIFLYTINYNDAALEQAVKIAKKLGRPIVTPFAGYSAIKAKKYGIKILWDVAPNAFLNLIENAECVCSNSFHGIAFSIILKKNFYRVGPVDKYGKIKVDDRIDNILKLCGLTGRNYNENYEYKQINYDIVDLALNKYRIESEQYIQEMLEQIG